MSASAIDAAAGAPAEPGWVDRRSGLGMDEFIAEYRVPRRPVVLADAAAAWPLYGKATPDWFRAHHGEHVVRVRGRDYRLAELLDLLEGSTAAAPAPYPCKFEIARNFRTLLPAVTPRFAHSLPDRQASALVPQKLFEGVNNLEVFFGGPGGGFPYLHYDVLRLHAWITQLYGEKEFTLYAPGQEHLLYVNPDMPWQSSIRDHHDPDYDRYPLFREAKCQKVTVRAGETLFLPCGWWHTARSIDVTISVAFDSLGPDNWGAFIADVVDERRRAGHPLRALGLGLWLRAITPVLALAESFGANRATGWGRR
jgi:hypothetical protein